MIAFNKRCGSILEVNAMLASHKLPTETVVFNQTGTLTTGVFRVCSVISPRLDSDMLLQIAAHVEAGSTHPIARAIRAAYAGPATRRFARFAEEWVKKNDPQKG